MSLDNLLLELLVACVIKCLKLVPSVPILSQFLKKFLHYSKHRIHPELTEDAREHIANAYASLRSKQVWLKAIVRCRTLFCDHYSLRNISPVLYCTVPGNGLKLEYTSTVLV